VTVGELSHREVRSRLTGNGLGVRFGPFLVRIRSDFRSLVPLLQHLYDAHPIAPSDAVTDFHVQVVASGGLRRWSRRQAWFFVDGRPPFWPLPAKHALAILEWGINWCIASRSHHLLLLHSAVVERDGWAILLPAWPGHGKSTLCAALIHAGWRLLSDEFGLVRPEDGVLVPLPRLIPLKNESIDVIRCFSPEAVMGPCLYGTRKGTVAHVRPPLESIRRADEPAQPGWLVFPRWIADAPLRLEPMAKAQSFLMVATNAFNYEILGETAFRLVADMVRTCDCYSLVYSDLDEAVATLARLTRPDNG
jgi:HprK-related kinase A